MNRTLLLKYWNSITRKPAPALPTIHADRPIIVEARHAILSNAICLKIATRLNELTIPLLGEDGLLEMATYYSLYASAHEFRKERHASPETAINSFLSNRFRVKDVGSQETIAKLIKLGFWPSWLRASGISPPTLLTSPFSPAGP